METPVFNCTSIPFFHGIRKWLGGTRIFFNRGLSILYHELILKSPLQTIKNIWWDRKLCMGQPPDYPYYYPL